MAIDLRLPKKIEPVTKRFKLPSDVAAEFELFVKAAQEGNGSGGVDQNVVLQAVLERAMKKDRGFRVWRKNYLKKESEGNGAGQGASKTEGTPEQ